jgi:hypothetical protein
VGEPIVLLPSPRPTESTPHKSGSTSRKQVEPIDENGDVVFRFRLKPLADPDALSLQEFYRQQLCDLLQIVRLYHAGQPLLVDEFAFVDSPDVRVRIRGSEPSR